MANQLRKGNAVVATPPVEPATMFLAPHQDPWAAPVPDQADVRTVAEGLHERLRRHRISTCLLLIGGDHGYWREERLGLREGAWLRGVDSHRGRSGEEWTWVAEEGDPDFLALVQDLERWHLEPGPGLDGLCVPFPGMPMALLVTMTQAQGILRRYVASRMLYERFQRLAWPDRILP